MKEKNAEFAKNLKALRKEAGLNQTETAERVAVSQQCVSQWENGMIEPTLSSLWALADLFGISVDELIGRKEY